MVAAELDVAENEAVDGVCYMDRVDLLNLAISIFNLNMRLFPRICFMYFYVCILDSKTFSRYFGVYLFVVSFKKVNR